MLVLLDRDGVLVEDRTDYVRTPDQLVPLPGALEAVARLSQAGHLTAVVTNQACVGKGIIDEAMLGRIHERLNALVRQAGGRLDAIYHCPDPPWAAGPRRKPEPGMLSEALRRFRSTPAEAMMIGDTLRDLEAAARLGVRRILVRSGQGAQTQARGLPPHVLPVAVHDDLGAAVSALLDGR
ncbi:D-glycero-alpha-D-manno-heptose-1,7-bisphosphate 7-phosphatase [Zavarzinia sp. CC-PAN008]|uniref:D-glycero-alpha-D-manno-heptose-1,7-bisphosphate 7-phosphatase n=1 Tax=Zavarzinia sp. CC-PAN008 TaxID=3243332 RepID=UPI003F7445CA